MIKPVTEIPDLLVIEPRIFSDDRGYFYESFNVKHFSETHVNTDFVQDNQSLSDANVVRGLHYQIGAFAQSKLVRVVQGSVWDVAVDLRKNSPTFGQWYGIELSGENHKQFYIPRGFAHGFVALEPNTIFVYKCDNYYSKDHERGIRFDDQDLALPWPIDSKSPIVSEKDLLLPTFKDADYFE